MPIVIITGGSGMIGTRLSRMLAEKDYQVIILTRKKSKAPEYGGRISYASWDPETNSIDKNAIAQADHIIHLAGAGVADQRWSESRKQEIVNSRTQSSALIVQALKEVPNKIQSVVSASAIGWYGPDVPGAKTAFVETDPPDSHFLGETCRLWEESIRPVQKMGKRLVIFRTGIVLSPDGGALEEFTKPVRFGLAAILGSGKQIVSWIQLDDLCRLYIKAIENDQLRGVYNAVAPNPVSNKIFTLELAKQMRSK
ncbi:MAG: TIGR01777 family oxidoreductase, partial [Chitinophagaceae bacterium]|nr:TIGR01777 family oxidoreductase [Chitinophagaceae bacterium]